MRMRFLSILLPVVFLLLALLSNWWSGTDARPLERKEASATTETLALLPPQSTASTKPAARNRPTVDTSIEFPAVWRGLAQGRALVIGDSPTKSPPLATLTFRPLRLLAHSERSISLGPSGASLGPAQVLTGWAHLGEATTAPRRAHVALVGRTATGNWREDDGTEVLFQWRLGSGEAEITRRVLSPLTAEVQARHGKAACLLRRSTDKHPTHPPEETRRFPITLRAAAQGGIEPATGEATRYVDPSPASESYALSLKEFHLLLVLDQSATGPNNPEELERIASQWLASVANVATIYENQLGVRLRLQELILVPDDPAFEDVPFHDALPNFTQWVASHRSRNTYQWDSAFKVGRGLSSSELGLAYVASLGRSDSIGIIDKETGWPTLAHEMGHSLGANHTKGGMMNAQANNGGDRDFFTQVSGRVGVTAAREIYDHSKDVLKGAHPLRHPEEIPFAKNDFRVLTDGESIRFDPLSNDLHQVRFGQWNPHLSLESVSVIHPREAGTLRHDGRWLEFEPTPAFRGSVSFSYTIRGSLGNDGQGWLHKGDVTLLVGDAFPPLDLHLTPGESRTIAVGNASGAITQPRDAKVFPLQDDEDQLLVRVSPQAAGTDSFSVGSRQFDIVYEVAQPVAHPDVYWHHPLKGSLRMRPLANDAPSSVGHRLGTPKNSLGTDDTFPPLESPPPGLRLVDAVNLSPAKGTLDIPLLSGNESNSPTGELVFTPSGEASGIVTLRYTAEDPSGLEIEGAITLHLQGSETLLVPQDAPARHHIPLTSFDAPFWTLPIFDDSPWTAGALPYGYEQGLGYEEWIETDIGIFMANVSSSLYLRVPFELEDPTSISDLLLRMRFDDGFVAYLNGNEVWRENAPESTTFNSRALEGREADAMEVFELSDARSVLKPGENLLAIHGMNAAIDSSDFLIMPELLALSSPKLASITSPKAVSVNVESGTGIDFQANADSDAIQLHWEVTEAPKGAATADAGRIEDNTFELFFITEGTYRIRLTATDPSGARTADERVVSVGAARPYDEPGDAIDAGPDLELDTFAGALSATLVPVIPGQTPSIVWKQLTGPGTVTFATPNAAASTATFSQTGQYRLQFLAERSGFTIFDDLVVTVRPVERSLINASTESTYQFYTPTDHESQWTSPDFSDLAWRRGGQGLGYDLTNAFNAYIDTNVQSVMQFQHSSVFVRYPFTLEHSRSIYHLALILRADDGCVVYLNGQEVHRQHAPLYDLSPASISTRTSDESGLDEPAPIDLTEFRHHLRPGYNVLGVHGLNQSLTSSDFLVHVALSAKMGQADRLPDGVEGTDALAAAFGDPTAIPRVTLHPDSATITFQLRRDFSESGGRLDVESSADLIQWRPWPIQDRQREAMNATLDRVSLTVPRPTPERTYFRLRVSF